MSDDDSEKRQRPKTRIERSEPDPTDHFAPTNGRPKVCVDRAGRVRSYHLGLNDRGKIECVLCEEVLSCLPSLVVPGVKRKRRLSRRVSQ